jgi:Uma2 family endonuclease
LPYNQEVTVRQDGTYTMALAEISHALLTAEEYWELISQPQYDDMRLELEDGVLVDVGESSPLNSIVGARIGYFLNRYVMQHDLGYVTGADGGFKLGERRVRIPDVGFIAKNRVSEIPKRFTMPPDLAVEIVSPTEDILKKAGEYLLAGTAMVWAIYAEDRTVFVFTHDADRRLQVQQLNMGDVLNGGDVLPGFSLTIAEIFPTS